MIKIKRAPVKTPTELPPALTFDQKLAKRKEKFIREAARRVAYKKKKT